MEVRPEHLPDFRDPPLKEVALTIYFEPLKDLRQAHIGMFWSKIRDSFPNVQDQPIAPLTVEDLYAPSSRTNFEFEVTNSPVPHRSLFFSKNGADLLQFQRDRLVHNWRKEAETNYPHFEALLDSFLKEYRSLELSLKDSAVQKPSIMQVEISYVNRIEAKALHDFLPFVSPIGLSVEGIGTEPDLEHINLRFPVVSADKTIGRLYIESSKQIDHYQMVLTFRAPALSATIGEAETLLTTGRAAIVEGFTNLTNQKYHEIWGRTK